MASQTVAPSATWESTDCDFDGVSNGQELINGSDPLVSVSSIDPNAFVVSMDNDLNVIHVTSNANVAGEYGIFNAAGQKVQAGALATSIPVQFTSGTYYVRIVTASRTYNYKIYKK